MKAKEVFGTKYLVVLRRYWNKYRHNAYCERICNTQEEAEEIAVKCENCDGEQYVILKIEKGVIKELC